MRNCNYLIALEDQCYDCMQFWFSFVKKNIDVFNTFWAILGGERGRRWSRKRASKQKENGLISTFIVGRGFLFLFIVYKEVVQGASAV